MLRVNLGVLLAERRLSASRLSADTGISKTTLTSLVNNTGKGIQYDTIDTICNYLGVTPQDFFEYVPLNYKLSIFADDLSLDIETHLDSFLQYVANESFKVEILLDIFNKNKKVSFDVAGYITNKDFGQNELSIYFDNEDDYKRFEDAFYNKLSEGFKREFQDDLVKTVSESTIKQLEEKNDFSDLSQSQNYSFFVEDIFSDLILDTISFNPF